MVIKIQLFGGRGAGGGGSARGKSGGGGASGGAAQPKQKNLMERARDGDLTASDFNKMGSGSRAALLGQTPNGTVVTASNGTQYTHTGNNKWSRSGSDVVLGRSGSRTSVDNSYVAKQTANGRMRSIRYKR